jgi:ATP-binding cassette subfamily B (MDR/TAP) protein 11
MNVANLGVGICIAFGFSWPITLLIIGFMPFLIIGGIFQTKRLAGFAKKDKEILESAGKVNYFSNSFN